MTTSHNTKNINNILSPACEQDENSESNFQIFQDSEVVVQGNMVVETRLTVEGTIPQIVVHLQRDFSTKTELAALLDLSSFDLQALIKTVEETYKHVLEPIPVVILMPKSKENVTVDLIGTGMISVFQIVAAQTTLHSNINLVGIHYEIDGMNDYALSEMVHFLMDTPHVSTVLHGAIIEMSRPKATLLSNSTSQSYALVTGGTKGIGEAIAHSLASQGHPVIITGRSTTMGHGEDLANRLRKQYNIDAIFLSLDLAHHESITTLVNEVKARGILLDVIVHNAAVGTQTSVAQATASSASSEVLLNVNVVGTIALQDELLKANVVNGQGCSVMVISSVGALRPFQEMHPIDQASKAMENQWAKYLNSQYPHLHVVALAPGATNTEMLQQSVLNKLDAQGQLQGFIHRLPKHMLIQPQYLASIVAFFSQNAIAQYLHGGVVAACCGLHLQYQPLPTITSPSHLLPSSVEAHFSSESNKYHKEKNPRGVVNFGSAVNTAIASRLVTMTPPSLPPFITTSYTSYQVPAGSEAFRSYVAEGSQYDASNTVTVNSIYAALSILAHRYQRVSVSGVEDVNELAFLSSHSRSVLISKELEDFVSDGEKCHFIILEGSIPEAKGVRLPDAIAFLKSTKDQQHGKYPIVIVLSSPQEQVSFASLLPHDYLIFVTVKVLTPNLSCAVIQTTNTTCLKLLQEDAYFFPVSSVIQAAIVHGHDIPRGNYDDLSDAIVRQFAQSDGIADLKKETLVYGTGASSVLEALGHILFRSGDTLGIDAPYYFGFVEDFGRSGVTLLPHSHMERDDYMDNTGKVIQLGEKNRRVVSTLKLRAQRAYEDGARGFLICNPHNPTGRVYAAAEIEELCEWAILLNSNIEQESGDSFHVIFDELYAHSIYNNEKQHTFYSAVPYTQYTTCIHVVRGFAKDFGLCGFKVGYGITSHPLVLLKAKEWKMIMRPHDSVANILTQFLKQSDYGDKVFKTNRSLLSSLFTIVQDLLISYQIPFLIPHAGVFVMIDLSTELKACRLENENTIFLRLLKERGVNVVQGELMHAKKGWFRVCPVLDSEESIREGIHRLGRFVNEELRSAAVKPEASVPSGVTNGLKRGRGLSNVEEGGVGEENRRKK
eukprot:gene5066-5565_t